MKLFTHNLSTGYRPGNSEKVVCRDLTLQVPEGKLTALLGPNGSGKSTLIRTLAGLQPALKGSVILEQKEISTWKKSDLARKIAVVLQESYRHTNLSVFELTLLGRIPYTGWLGHPGESDRLKAMECLGQVGILGLKDKKISELSDGEWQKTIFAKALAQDTPTILLDEPTAHLDLLSKIELVDGLRKIAVSGSKTILFSTHDLDLALQMADHLWLMDPNGKVVAGAPEDLVLQGKIAGIYSKNGIGFDEATGTVRVPMPKRDRTLHLQGSGPAFHWTRRALERMGFVISDDPLTPASILVRQKEKKISWEARVDTRVLNAESISDLLLQLEQL